MKIRVERTDRNHRDVATPFRPRVAIGALLLIALGGTMADAGAQSMPVVRRNQEDSPLDPATHRRVVEVLESYYNFEFERARNAG
jgi:hypothetical protein